MQYQPIQQYKNLLSTRYGNLREFSQCENIPYQCLTDWYKRGLPASIENFFRLAEILGESPEALFEKFPKKKFSQDRQKSSKSSIPKK